MKNLRRPFLLCAAISVFGLPAAARPAPQAAAAGAPAAQELKLTVTGDVPMPVTLSARDFASLPRETAEVTEMDGTKSVYEGVTLQELLKAAGISWGKQMRGKALAGYVLASAKDGYQVVFGMGELDPGLGGAKVLAADKRDGKPLFEYQGPIRLVVPADKEGARSVRMLDKLQVVMLRK